MVSCQRVLLVAADPREFRGLVRFCSRLEPLGWPIHWARCGELNGRRVVLVANGAGAARAGQAVDVAKAAGGLDLVCSMGFCGALDRNLGIGDIFVAESIRATGRSFPVARPRTGQSYVSGVLASIDRVAQTAEEKRNLRASGAQAVEMEAAGVASKAEEWGLPLYCVRSVTDLAEESFGLDFNAALDSGGRFDTWRLIAAASRRPRVLFPELVRLRQRCRIAARTLGEFVADCRF